MSQLHDPRVLFSAERTLLAWTRTAAGLIALGFLIDRGALMVDGSQTARLLGTSIGVAFTLLGAALSGLSAIQYRRSVAALNSDERPPHYWVNLAFGTSLATAVLALLLVAYLVLPA